MANILRKRKYIYVSKTEILKLKDKFPVSFFHYSRFYSRISTMKVNHYTIQREYAVHLDFRIRWNRELQCSQLKLKLRFYFCWALSLSLLIFIIRRFYVPQINFLLCILDSFLIDQVTDRFFAKFWQFSLRLR